MRETTLVRGIGTRATPDIQRRPMSKLKRGKQGQRIRSLEYAVRPTSILQGGTLSLDRSWFWLGLAIPTCDVWNFELST